MTSQNETQPPYMPRLVQLLRGCPLTKGSKNRFKKHPPGIRLDDHRHHKRRIPIGAVKKHDTESRLSRALGTFLVHPKFKHKPADGSRRERYEIR